MSQTRIPGTERHDNPEIEAICLEADAADIAWNEAGKKREEKRQAINAMMKLKGIESYRFWVPRLGKFKVAFLKQQDSKLVIEESDEGDSAQTEMPTGGETSKPKAKGLKGLAASAAADSNTNTEETEDGDVTVPETAAPKGKRGSKRKGSAK